MIFLCSCRTRSLCKQQRTQVFGTVTKSAVATGADLVSYGPFNNNNNFRQPYNSDLNFETNDFSIMFWVYDTELINIALLLVETKENLIYQDLQTYGNKLRIYTRNSSEDLRHLIVPLHFHKINGFVYV